MQTSLRFPRHSALIFLPAIVLLHCGFAEAQQVQADTLYTNAAYRWSISYPLSWTVDGGDSSFVRVLPPGSDALCGIHSGNVRFKTLDEFTEFMLAHMEQSLKQQGFASVISDQHRISLPRDVIGNDVLVDIVPGGRSHRIFVLADGRGFGIDCETAAENWERLGPFFDRIVSSFTVEQ